MQMNNLSAVALDPNFTEALDWSQLGDIPFDNMAARIQSSIADGTGADTSGNAIMKMILNFAAQAEQQIAEQKLRIAELEELSMTDELTGLANRRGLVDFLRRTLASARRYREEGVIAYLDLDDFKTINDDHGHEAGDRLLRQVAAFLTRNLRDSDFVARVGGDEFVIVLTRAIVAPAMERALSLREELSATYVEYHGTRLFARASTGLASYDGTSDIDSILRRADQAMYMDKRTRRRTLRVI
jgi:diguanylate cyclase (GGDEF)-like protein